MSALATPVGVHQPSQTQADRARGPEPSGVEPTGPFANFLTGNQPSAAAAQAPASRSHGPSAKQNGGPRHPASESAGSHAADGTAQGTPGKADPGNPATHDTGKSPTDPSQPAGSGTAGAHQDSTSSADAASLAMAAATASALAAAAAAAVTAGAPAGGAQTGKKDDRPGGASSVSGPGRADGQPPNGPAASTGFTNPALAVSAAAVAAPVQPAAELAGQQALQGSAGFGADAPSAAGTGYAQLAQVLAQTNRAGKPQEKSQPTSEASIESGAPQAAAAAGGADASLTLSNLASAASLAAKGTPHAHAQPNASAAARASGNNPTQPANSSDGQAPSSTADADASGKTQAPTLPLLKGAAANTSPANGSADTLTAGAAAGGGPMAVAGAAGQIAAASTQTNSANPALPQAPGPAAIPIAGLGIEIAARAQAGNNRFEIRLDPPDLGRIEVRLDVDKQGHVTSHVVAERADTLDLLRRDAPELQQALADAGLKTGDNAMQFSLRDQGFTGQQQGRQNQFVAQIVVPDSAAPPANAAPLTYGRWLGGSGGVDIRV